MNIGIKPQGVSGRWREGHFHRERKCHRSTASRRRHESLLPHSLDGVPFKAHANRPSHVHVLGHSTRINSESNDTEPGKASFSRLLGVFSLDEVSLDRRRCYAILDRRSRLGMSVPKSRENECAQKRFATGKNKMPS